MGLTSGHLLLTKQATQTNDIGGTHISLDVWDISVLFGQASIKSSAPLLSTLIQQDIFSSPIEINQWEIYAYPSPTNRDNYILWIVLGDPLFMYDDIGKDDDMSCCIYRYRLSSSLHPDNNHPTLSLICEMTHTILRTGRIGGVTIAGQFRTTVEVPGGGDIVVIGCPRKDELVVELNSDMISGDVSLPTAHTQISSYSGALTYSRRDLNTDNTRVIIQYYK